MPFISAPAIASAAPPPRVTSSGLPVAIFDRPAPERVTHPAMVVPPPELSRTVQQAPPRATPTAGGGERVMISDIGNDHHERVRNTQMGFVPARPEIILTRPLPNAADRRDAARQAVKPYLRRPTGGVARVSRRRAETPFWVYIGLGFALGLVLFGVYWIAHTLASR